MHGVCLHAPFVCAAKRYICACACALRFTAPLNPIQKRGQRWKVNSGRTLAEGQGGQRGGFRGASKGGVHGAEAGSSR